MKISIVTSYYNRRPLLETTLKSINESVFKDFEFIVVDDGSDKEHEIADLMNTYSFLTVVKIEKENKNHVNPAIPFNVGFGIASGDIIMLQNPECFHLNDILLFVNENLGLNDYFSFSTYSINESQTNAILSESEITREKVIKLISPLLQQTFYDFNKPGWYNHSKFRAKGYHFCSAIHRSNLIKLNGFDERYGEGIGYDDDELLHRIQRLGLNIKIIDNQTVVHQYHNQAYVYKNSHELTQRNFNLFQNHTKIENQIRANNGKTIII